MYIGHRAEPSFRFPQKLAKDVKGKKITSYAKQLALTMFSYASQRTGKVNKTQRELAKLSGIALDTVSRKLQELEKAYLPLRDAGAARRPTLAAVPEDMAQLPCLFEWGYADIQNNEDRPKITRVLTSEERKSTAPIFWNINMPGQTAGGISSALPCKAILSPTFLREKVGVVEGGTRRSGGERRGDFLREPAQQAGALWLASFPFPACTATARTAGNWTRK